MKTFAKIIIVFFFLMIMKANSQDLESYRNDYIFKMKQAETVYRGQMEKIIKIYTDICKQDKERSRKAGSLDLIIFLDKEIERVNIDKTLPSDIPKELKGLQDDVQKLRKTETKIKLQLEEDRNIQRDRFVANLKRIERIEVRNGNIEQAKKIRETINWEYRQFYTMKGTTSWENSSVKVKKGDVITILAPDSGQTNSIVNHHGVKTNVGRLIAKIGSQVFDIGKKNKITTKQDGELLLRNNFGVSNNGCFLVTIIVD